MSRKYIPKGGNGGKRAGAGRPKGAKSPLKYGETKAVIAAGLRVPEDAKPEQRALADRAQQRIIDVMEQKVGYLSASGVLKAAAHLREEICGAVKQKIEHSGFDTLTDEQLKARFEKLVSPVIEHSGTLAPSEPLEPGPVEYMPAEPETSSEE